MPKLRIKLSTGLPALDHVFRGLMPGDNIVWQVESIRDYLPFIPAYSAYARENRQKIFYFRFAQHEPLLEPSDGAEIITLNPDRGFEPFLSEIHRVINEEGRGCLYLFDCLSELAPDWCSDRMLGNFFMLTCPYLYDRAAIAYFAILRNYHSFHALKPIASTTQILVDVYRHREKLYIQPLKVQYRFSPTMYMLHAWENDSFVPVNQSGVITEILSHAPWSHSETASAQLGFWTKTFAQAQTIQDDLDQGNASPEKAAACFHKILRMLISHDDKVLALAERFLTLRDLLAIRRRMIGTGLIGGKAVGMILARAILRQSDPARWGRLLEMHDSFFVGADVFYTYLVQNGCWWMIHRLKPSEGPDDDTETARRRIHAGEFPDYIVRQYADMLDYFGQSPILVRSSSLLEDNFGNAFAGKYESVFCANQGGSHKRLEDFLFAVRTVYASTMGEDALSYRQRRGLMHQDEQMGLLIQRVSGNAYNSFFFPQAAGVAFSFNPYAWDPAIDPSAGMIRLVFGMGTRAVDRSDDDYTRIVALNAPARRPECSFSEVAQYAQRRVDVLDLEANHLASVAFADLERLPGIPVALFASRDRESRRDSARAGREPPWVLTFDPLLAQTAFVSDMRDMLHTLQEAYQYPVDVEFTLNFTEPGAYQINLVQCRPLQVRGAGDALGDPPAAIPPQDVMLESRGAVIGNSVEMKLDWILYVAPGAYSQLRESDRYSVARLIGEITHLPALAKKTVMLLGPGRWGTATPALGVPVSFIDIAGISVLGEIVAMRENLVPDVSLGTHFFNELVEREILYLALFPNKPGNALQIDFFERQMPNRLTDLLPAQLEWEPVVRLLDVTSLPGGGSLTINANSLRQHVVCYRLPPEPEAGP
ncbi:MAG: PEP/pyruvate-binding domain-containing protein [Kiritimatiellia bacterium]